MITNLTKKQEAKLVEYRDKWLKIGLSTETPSFGETKKIIDDVYTHLLNKSTVPVVVLDNPYLTWVAVSQYAVKRNQVRDQVWNQVSNQVENQVWNQVSNQVWNQVENQVWNQVSNQVWNQVRDQVRDQVWNQVSNQVWNQVSNQVENQVWNQVSNQVWNQVRDQVSNQVGKNKRLITFIYPYFDGNLKSGYFAFYEYCIQELEIKIEKDVVTKFNIYKETSKLSLIYPFDDICFVCKKPIEIHFNESKVLHNEKGASIKYEGGFELYHLNGVSVDKKIVMTPSEKITVKQILSEKNVEVRRELLRKVGIDNFIKKSKSKPIETSDDKQYELYKIKIGTDKYGMYLKMKNPSLENTYHFEGVSDTCCTIKDALAWRDSEVVYIKPNILT
jgi:hypothetical protein